MTLQNDHGGDFRASRVQQIDLRKNENSGNDEKTEGEDGYSRTGDVTSVARVLPDLR